MPPKASDSQTPGDLRSVVDGLQEIGQRVSSTAAAWINPTSSIVKDITPHLKRPSFQKRLLSTTSPSELLRGNLSPSEIIHRQITYLPDDLLRDLPEDDGSQVYSLFQGFEASLPESPQKSIKAKPSARQSSTHRNSSTQRSSSTRRSSSMQRNGRVKHRVPETVRLEKERDQAQHVLDVLAIRKSLASTEIKEIDTKLSMLGKMRADLIEKLRQLEIQEAEATDDLQLAETNILELKELENLVEVESETATTVSDNFDEESAAFLSQSTYGSLSKGTANRARKRKAQRRRSAPILHQHYDTGALIKSLSAHNEAITSLDFDFPLGTMVTASIDDTVRVWNLATGRCQGLLEGHIASVRCLQLEDTLVATGSTDAKIKLWDLGLSDQYSAVVPPSAISNLINKYRASNSSDSEDERSSQTAVDGRERRHHHHQPEISQVTDCCIHTLDAHVGEVTALHFINQTLVSGSQDRTIRQWDMSTGRLMQTMDILGFSGSLWNSSHATAMRGGGSSGDFVGALQCFEQGLAAGTSDGMVRFWDLRTGAVARELTGHTGAVTALQFDDMHLVSGSLDRSVRIWDLRTGSIYDAFAYEQAITDLHFDAKRIVTAAGESYAKVYDRIDGRHWGCGEDDVLDSGIVKTVKSKEGYLVGGRSNGMVGIWSI